ncbi:MULTISPECIES: hypothetical protein [Methanosarcina]|uniref:Uncharacterized protein n=2 Tax=Methanosarcina barkeri TaxID=2208 RepID=A0A0G3CKV1_METBA|nr:MULTISPECIES: hypothetical protein [Methanosarcina]AKB58029.1 hypothetical protein MSBR2_1513 [Methanosarcina barkeri 227]AKJ39742.1 hypothetical protein MCM1_2743 [Methanosarcina barkeri CM1]OED09356.1 hypothetical protein A9239_08415 [Methanosarcina sp. A14]
MTSCKLFERTESYYLDPSRIGKTLKRYQSLKKHNTTYFSLNRFFHLTTTKRIPGSQNQASKKKAPEFQNQASEKLALIFKEDLEW